MKLALDPLKSEKFSIGSLPIKYGGSRMTSAKPSVVLDREREQEESHDESEGNIRIGGQQGRPPDLSNPGLGGPIDQGRHASTRKLVHLRIHLKCIEAELNFL
jgi:hypothetical protein